jgi:glutathione reductase (NADPH)
VGGASVAYTIPAVGLGEAEVRQRFAKVKVRHEQASDWHTARQSAESVYGYKTLVDGDADAILAAHLVGPHVEQVINLFALAMRRDLRASQFLDTMFACPTAASDVVYTLG